VVVAAEPGDFPIWVLWVVAEVEAEAEVR